MSYDNLDRISATIFKPANNIALTHVVKVASRDKDGRRRYGHAEYEYKSNAYIDRNYLKSIKLTFDSYLLLEDITRDWSDNRAVKIGYVQLPIFNRTLKKVVNWFEDEKYDNLYYYEEDILKLNMEYHDLRELIALGPDKAVQFRPTVILDDETFYEGVQIMINNDRCVGYISVDNLFAFYHILYNINLYDLGMHMLNYIRRPEFGEFNNSVINDSNEYQDGSRTQSNIPKDQKPSILKGFFK